MIKSYFNVYDNLCKIIAYIQQDIKEIRETPAGLKKNAHIAVAGVAYSGVIMWLAFCVLLIKRIVESLL